MHLPSATGSPRDGGEVQALAALCWGVEPLLRLTKAMGSGGRRFCQVENSPWLGSWLSHRVRGCQEVLRVASEKRHGQKFPA